MTLLAGIGWLVAGCSGAPSVVVAVARPQALTLAAAGTGVFAPSVDVPVVLGFRGTVTAVEVELGQHVDAGQPLLFVSSTGLNNVAGRLGTRASSLAAAVTVLQRAGASPAEIAAAQAQAKLAQNALEVASSGRGQIRATISGTISDISVKPGSDVLSDESLLHIVRSSQLTVTAELASAFMGRIHNGMPALVRATGDASQRLAGLVSQVAPVASAGGQTFTVIVSVARPGTALPGKNAYVSIPLVVHAPVAVNHLAVLDADTWPTVFVVEGTEVRQRQVGVGVTDGQTTQILSGVAPGDKVVIAGTQQLTDGSSVSVRRSRD